MPNRKLRIAYFIVTFVVFILAINTKVAFSVESVSTRPSLEEIQRDRFQFLQDKWKAYWCSLLQVKATWTYRNIQETTVKEHEAEFEAYYPYSADVRKSVRGETVSVVGPRYSFELIREKADEQWVIHELWPNPSPQDSCKDWKFPTPYVRFSRNMSVGYHIYNTLGVGVQTGCVISIPALFALDGLELRKLEYVTLDGEEFLYANVEFRQKYANTSDSNNGEAQSSQAADAYCINGEVWLDTKYFLVAKAIFCEKIDVQEITSNISCSYEVVSGVPFPKFYKNENRCKDEGINERATVEIEFHSFQKIEDYEPRNFTFSRFGLPEPDLGDKTVSRLRYIFVIIGLCLIGFGVWRINQKSREKLEA